MQRNLSIDLLKIFAIVAVIAIHVSSNLVFGEFSTTSLDWWIGNIFFALSSWAVPVFIMASGFFLLNPKKQENYKQFFAKRCNKILIPSAFWLVFYSLTKVKAASIGLFSIESFNMIVENIIKGTASYHLWFIYLIIGLYLLVPTIRFLIKDKTQKDILGFLILWFLTVFFMKLFDTLIGTNILSEIAFYGGFMGYFILGYYLSLYKINENYSNKIYLFGVVSLLFSMIATNFIVTNSTILENNYFYQTYSINIMLLSLAVFVFFQNLYIPKFILDNPTLSKIIISLSSACFGVYLIHPYVIYVLDSSKLGFSLNNQFIHPVLGIPLTILGTAFLSFLITFVLQKIPFLKRVI